MLRQQATKKAATPTAANRPRTTARIEMEMSCIDSFMQVRFYFGCKITHSLRNKHCK